MLCRIGRHINVTSAWQWGIWCMTLRQFRRYHCNIGAAGLSDRGRLQLIGFRAQAAV
jgi:hypothetical protein